MRHEMENGTTFTSPFNDKQGSDSIEWRLRYSQDSITGSDMYLIASMLQSFCEIIMKPVKTRNRILSKMRRDVYALRKARSDENRENND